MRQTRARRREGEEKKLISKINCKTASICCCYCYFFFFFFGFFHFWFLLIFQLKFLSAASFPSLAHRISFHLTSIRQNMLRVYLRSPCSRNVRSFLSEYVCVSVFVETFNSFFEFSSTLPARFDMFDFGIGESNKNRFIHFVSYFFGRVRGFSVQIAFLCVRFFLSALIFS